MRTQAAARAVGTTVTEVYGVRGGLQHAAAGTAVSDEH